MALSIKTKFAALTAISLLLLAGGVAIVTSGSVEKSMTVSQERAAVNALNLSSMHVRDQYKSLVRWRVSEVQAVRQFLSDFASTVSILEEQTRLGGGELTDPDPILNKLHLPENVGILAFDQGLNVVFTRGDIPLRATKAGARDIKDRPVATTMRRMAVRGQPASCVIKDGDTEYYGTHVWLESSNWIIGLWINLNALRAKEAKLVDDMIRDLNQSIGQVSIGSSGYLFIFKGDGETVISPPGTSGHVLLQEDGASGTKLLDLLRQGAGTPDGPVTAVVEENGTQRTWQARVRHMKPLDWYIVAVAYLDEVKTPGRELSTKLALFIASAAVVILLTSLWLTGRLTAPLLQLAEHARTVPEQDFMDEAEAAPVLESLAASGDIEVQRMAQSLLFMDHALRERIKELITMTAARERIESELGVARDIQMGLLPDAILPETVKDGASPATFRMDAFLVPAKEVGGDLYDCFMLDDEHLFFAVGDVSDKGVPAALFMSVTMALLRAGARLGQTPEELMASINRDLARDNPRCMFVTMALGIMNVKTGHVAYANGGHNFPVLCRADGSADYLEEISGPLLGAMDDNEYTGLSVTLAPGDSLFIYSDGVTEAMDGDNAMYSDERLLETLTGLSDATPEGIISLVRDDVAAHVETHPASDDITMMCIRYDGPGNNS